MSASFFKQRTLHRPGERPAATTDLESTTDLDGGTTDLAPATTDIEPAAIVGEPRLERVDEPQGPPPAKPLAPGAVALARFRAIFR